MAQGTPEASPAGNQIDPTADQPQQSFPLTEEKKTLRVMIPSSANVEDFATNEFTAWLEERTNVHIEWEVLPLDADGTANTALNVRLASGDYAEVLMNFAPTPSVLQLYGQQGVFLPLNNYIDQLAVYGKGPSSSTRRRCAPRPLRMGKSTRCPRSTTASTVRCRRSSGSTSSGWRRSASRCRRPPINMPKSCAPSRMAIPTAMARLTKSH